MLFTKLEVALIRALRPASPAALGLPSTTLSATPGEEPDDLDVDGVPEPVERVPEDPSLARDTTSHFDVAQVMAILMMSKAFRSLDRLQDCLKAGSLTVIEGVSPEWAFELSQVVRSFLPSTPGRCLKVHELGKLSSRNLSGSYSHALVMEFQEDGIAVDWQAKWPYLERTLAWHIPTFVVCSKAQRVLPSAVAHLITNRIIVGPPTKSMLKRLLRMRYGASVTHEVAASGDYTPAQLSLACSPHIDPTSAMRRLSAATSQAGATLRSSLALADLHGMRPLQDWAEDLAFDLACYRRGEVELSSISKGALVSGPPGIGKTVSCQAIAQHAGVNVIVASVARWLGYRHGNLGDFCSIVQRTFADAVKQAPVLLVIDELDALPARGSGDPDDRWWNAAVTAVLECLDGLDRRDGVIVVGLCNHPDRLDPALVRAGRFDTKIPLGLPDVPALAAILANCARPEIVDQDMISLAAGIAGSSAADAAQLVRDARRRARRRGGRLQYEDVATTIADGRARPDETTLRRAAIHETGHALAAIVNGFSLRNVSIAESFNKDLAVAGTADIDFGRGGLGTWAEIDAIVRVHLAGRAAESIAFGSISAAASHDLEVATRLLLRVVGASGMGTTLASLPHGSSPAALVSLVEHHLVRLYSEVHEQLQLHREVLLSLADELTRSVWISGAAFVSRVPTRIVAHAKEQQDAV